MKYEEPNRLLVFMIFIYKNPSRVYFEDIYSV